MKEDPFCNDNNRKKKKCFKSNKNIKLTNSTHNNHEVFYEEHIKDREHWNVWFTNNLREIMKNQSIMKIKLLFKPYFTSFRRMSEFFGLSTNYFPTQRMKEYSKNAIAISKLHRMKNSMKKELLQWKKQHPDIINGLNYTENEILNFIDLYEAIFKPKPTPCSQIEDYHPNLDFNYFSEINTLEKAYWLGFLFADGWIGLEKKQSGCYYRIGFGQKSEDKERVIEFCKALGLNIKYIEEYKIVGEEGNIYHFSRIRFLSGKVEWVGSMAKDLINWGIKYKKTGKDGKRVKDPIFPNLKNDKLMLAFLLGLFDGDGSLRLYTTSKDKIYVSPQIISANRNFLEKIKEYYKIQNNVSQKEYQKIDYETGIVNYRKVYGLTLGTRLYQNMILVMKNSMERKRISIESFTNTPIRKWLLQVLSKEKLKEMLKILSTYRIAKLLGISKSVIDRFSKNVYNLEVPMRKDVSDYEIKYWTKFLNEIGKYPRR